MNPGVVFAALAYVAWGLFPLYLKQVALVPPLEVVAHRTVWSLVFSLAVLALLRRWSWWRSLDRQVLWKTGLSALFVATNWLGYVWAIATDHVVDASLGYFINPLVNVALGYLVLHERLRAAQWVAIGFATAGVLWLTWQLGHTPWISLMLAFTFGLYGLMRKTSTLGAIEGLTVETLLLAPIAVGALLWWSAHGQHAVTDAAYGGWLIGTGPLTAGALMLFAAGARRVPLSTMGLIQYVAPTLQLMLGVWVYHEPMSSARLIGFALIWAGLAIYSADSLFKRPKASG
ncbi:EamA family transporter RarD [Roseateles paludis]|jgi:chloramphenicol-sensitive protein RarD|uniref:EamA family transporter RarD n=1 Tax=Roseateles paludis TaxID=3145238 RepID=A0ABV0G0I2_9BURK